MQREYYLTDSSGKRAEQLTRVNDPHSMEYVWKRVLVAASDFSPDGRYLAGTMGMDQGPVEARFSDLTELRSGGGVTFGLRADIIAYRTLRLTSFYQP